MTALAEQFGYTFVGSHPMAGKEKNGFDASDENLFMGASFIITPCGAPHTAVNTLSGLALEIGFGTIKITTPEEHDRMIAFTSQLPHVLACAYVLSPSCPNHNGFSAGSYRDVSRVANINAKLWSELFMKTVHVNTGRPYDIYIERGVLDFCGEYVKKLSAAEKVLVVTDTNVAPHYQWRILNSLEKQDLQVKTHIFKAGEEKASTSAPLRTFTKRSRTSA